MTETEIILTVALSLVLACGGGSLWFYGRALRSVLRRLDKLENMPLSFSIDGAGRADVGELIQRFRRREGS